MSIRIVPARRVRKIKTPNGQEVLRRLEAYLESECDDPVEILCGFWKDQQDAISYQELRQAVLDGTLTTETLELWRQDYSILVADRLNNMWTKAIEAGPKGQPILGSLAFEFNMQTPGIFDWLKERGANFVTVCTQEQQDAIAALLTMKMREGHTVDELARLIRPCIGLTEGQAKANARYYDSIVENLRKEHPRMKIESIRKKARDAALKYAERQHRERAFTIAQTESAFAYNWGADEGIRQAQAEGYLGMVKKRWSTSGDDAVCNICAALEGVEIDMDSDFSFRGKVLFAGHHMLPPAHPRCACAIEYIEAESSRMADSNWGPENASPDAETGMLKLGEIDVEKTDEALEYYGNLFRNDTVENVLVIDRQGNVYYAQGDASSVNIGIMTLAGAFVTHNHPISNGIVSFGEDDFYFLRDHQDIMELRCVNKEYDYSISVLKDMSKVVYNNVYREAFQYFQEEGFEAQHKVMEILKERGYVRYVRKKVGPRADE